MSTHLCDILWPECVLCLPYNFTHLSSNTNKHESVNFMVTTPCMWHATCTHRQDNVPWIGSALFRILSAARVSSHQSIPRIRLLQEGAGSVNNHHSASNFLCSLFGCFSMLTLLDCGIYRQSHSRIQCTPSIDFVTFSNVRGVAAIKWRWAVHGKPCRY